MATKTRTLLSTGEELDLRLLPRLGTRRNYDRRTLGAEVGQVARLLGRPLLPHQQYAADVALEVDDDDELVYREVNLAWPRRGAKTDLIRSVGAHRCRVLAKRWGPQNVYYTAQSGIAARRKWEHDQVKFIDQSKAYGPLGRTKPVVRGRYGRVKLDNNDPGIFWFNGSMWRPAPPTDTAGHGDDADLAVIDEAFAHTDDRVEQAYGPAMLTRRSPQLWVISAAGHDRSRYWYPKVLEGRKLDGSTEGPTCYLEYSAGDDEDPFDRATWWRRIPTLGFTVTEAALAAELAKAQRGDPDDDDEQDEGAGDVGLERFLRPYLGIWCRVPVLARSRPRVITSAQWLHPDNVYTGQEPARPEAFGVDVSPDRTTAAIGWSGVASDGRRRIGVLEHRPGRGVGWVVEAVAEIRRRSPNAAICVDPRSDVSGLLVELEKVAGELVKTSAQDMAAACGALYDAVVEHRVQYRRQSALEAAVDAAARRPLAGAWAWDRRESLGDITPLVAVTLAHHVHRLVPAGRKPVFW